MRMNYRKRLWPVLALLPVFALAAALALGLSGHNTPDAQAQGVVVATTDVLPAVGTNNAGVALTDAPMTCKVDSTITGGAVTYRAPQCIAPAGTDTFNVTFVNSVPVATEAVDNLIVYATGGTFNTELQAMDAASTAVGKKGVQKFQVNVPGRNAFNTDGEMSIAINRSWAKDGDVYVIVYDDISQVGTTNLTATATDWPATPTAADYTVVVQFLGPPVASSTDGTTTTDRSAISACSGGTGGCDTATKVGGKFTKVVDVPTGRTVANMRLTLADANGKPIRGFVPLTIGGPASTQFTASSLKTHRPQVGATGTIPIAVQGLPETGAFLIPITATIGDLEIVGNLRRIGDEASEVSVNGYACAYDMASDDEQQDDASTWCAAEEAALATETTGDDPDALTIVAPGDRFLLAGNALDSAGNKGVDLNLIWSAADADAIDALAASDTSDVAFTDNTDLTGDREDPEVLDTAVIEVASDASLGKYGINVEDTDENDSVTVEFTVAGDPDMYTIAGADIVALNTYEEYTVTVTDANGNIPVLKDDNRCITIGVRGQGFTPAQDLRAPVQNGGPCDGLTRLNNSGGATFTVEAPIGIAGGTVAVIRVYAYGRIVANKNITFGTATPPDAPDPPSALGNPTALSVTSSADGAATVTWTAAENATIHWVWRTKPDGTSGMYHMAAGDAATLTIEELDSGDSYYFIVIAGRAGPSGTTWSNWSNWSALTAIQ